MTTEIAINPSYPTTLQRAPRETDGRFEIMGREGDTKLMWDKHADDEVDAARETFRKLRAKGYLAFKAKKNGDQGEAITEFDPKAERLIMVPPMAGG